MKPEQELRTAEEDEKLESLLDYLDTLYLVDLNKRLIDIVTLEKQTRVAIRNYVDYKLKEYAAQFKQIAVEPKQCSFRNQCDSEILDYKKQFCGCYQQELESRIAVSSEGGLTPHHQKNKDQDHS